MLNRSWAARRICGDDASCAPIVPILTSQYKAVIGQAVDQFGVGRKPDVQLSADLACRQRAHAHRQKEDFQLLDRQIDIRLLELFSTRHRSRRGG